MGCKKCGGDSFQHCNNCKPMTEFGFFGNNCRALDQKDNNACCEPNCAIYHFIINR